MALHMEGTHWPAEWPWQHLRYASKDLKTSVNILGFFGNLKPAGFETQILTSTAE